MTFSEKLKLLRKEKKLTQKEASKQIGIALSSLRKYEQVGNPEFLTLEKIKNFYNVSYDYLLDDNCNTKNFKSHENIINLMADYINDLVPFSNPRALALFIEDKKNKIVYRTRENTIEVFEYLARKEVEKDE